MDFFWNVDNLAKPEENFVLYSPLMKKVLEIIFYVEGAPGHDGIPFLFYQKILGHH